MRFVSAHTGVNSCNERGENYHFHGVISRTRVAYRRRSRNISWLRSRRTVKEKNISLARFKAAALMHIIILTDIHKNVRNR